jgi:hypothetical protein
MVLVASDDGSREYAWVWNGATWVNRIALTTSGGGDDRTDIYAAYAQQSGDALVVYGAGSSSLRYRTWNGSVWSGEGSLAVPSPATGNVRWTTLASDPASDRIAVGVTTFNADSWTAIWSGTAWGDTQVLTQSAPGTTFPSVAVAFEAQSGDLVTLFGIGSSSVQYRITNPGGAWIGGNAFSVGATPNSMMLDADPSTDRIMAIVQNDNQELWAAQWSGSAWGTPTLLEDDTGEVKNQPWVFQWGRYDPSLAYVVINANDSGPGSLREKITLSNSSPTIDTITFAGDFTINLATELPDISHSATIDAESNTVVVDGSAVPLNADTEGIDIHTANVTVRGLEVTGFDIGIETQGQNSVIDGNIVYSNAVDGIAVEMGASGVVIINNIVGLDSVGDAAGNGDDGIDIKATAGVAIGEPGNGNVISSNGSDGIYLEGAATQNTTIRANYIGTDLTGTAPRPNGDNGIRLWNGVSATTIGDPVAGFANVIAFNGSAGVYLQSDAGASNEIFGNSIHSNGALGIALEWNGTSQATPLPNDPGDGDVGPNLGQNYPIPISAVVEDGTLTYSGTLDTGAGTYSIDAYFSFVGDASGNGEGELYLGPLSATSGAIGGDVSASGITTDGVLTLAATAPDKSTSEFSPWIDVDFHPTMDQILGDRSDPEGSVISLSASATDLDGDTLLYVANGLPTGLAIDSATGLISGTIDFDASTGSPYVVAVWAEDPTGYQDGYKFTWTIGNVNRGPIVVHPGQQTFTEGDAVSFVMTATDPDGDNFTWSATGLPPGIAIDPASGLVSGTLPYDASAGSVYNSTIRAQDDGVPSAAGAALVNWTINDLNRAPVVANPGDQANDENDVVSLPMVAIDPDGDGLTWDATGLPLGLSIDTSSGLISGTLTFDSAGIHPVTVRALDGGSPTAQGEASFTWTVADVNRSPIVTSPGAQSSAEGDAVSLTISGSDPDGDTLTWSVTGLPGGLGIDPGSGVVSGTIDFTATGSHSVTLRATDDGSPSLFTEVVFPWDVTDTNRAPLITNPGDRSNAEGDIVTFAIGGSDPDGDAVTWSATGLPTGLVIDPTSGVISGDIKYSANSGSPWAVAVRATDNGVPVLWSEVDFQWTVINTNRRVDVINPGDQSDAEGDAISLQMIGTDPDGDGITWSATGLPPGLSIGSVSGVISGVVQYDAAAGSPYTVTVTGNDNGTPVKFTDVQFTWTVANTNRQPVLVSPGNQSDAEGDAVSLAVSGSDPDGNGLTWTATGLPGGVSIDSLSGTVSGTLTYSSAGVHSVVVRATDDDSSSLFTEVAFGWTVANTNRAPVVVLPGDQSGAEGDAVSLAVSGSDPDGNGLTWTATGLPGGVSIDSLSGTVSGTLTYSSAGVHSVAVRATDDGSPSLFGEVAFTWTVANTNRSPVVVSSSNQSDAEGDTVSVAVSGSDPDGNGLTWSATGLPGGVSIDSGSGVISGTLSYTSSGVHSVTVRATDDGSPSLFDVVAFSWSVANTNRQPVVVSPGNQSDAENGSISLPISGYDPDLNTLTWTATGLPPNLVIDPATGTISGTLSYTSAGTHSVTVRATDDGSPVLFAEVAFTWSVANTNRAPVVAYPGAQSDAENDVVSVAVSGSDPDGNGLTWSASGLPGGLSIGSASGTISGTLSFTSAGTHNVTVRATDDGSPNLFDETTFSWTVANTNRQPVVVSPGAQSDAENDTINLPISGYDPDSNGVTWSATGLPGGLSISSSTGTISGALSYSSSGTHSVVVRVTDDGSPVLFTEVALDWVVANTNRAPTVTDPGDRTDAEGASIDLGMVASDPDGNGLSWSASGLPAGLSIDSASGVVSGSVSFAAAGVHAVTVRATDDDAAPLFGGVTFDWTVTNTNRAPVVINPGPQTTNEGSIVSVGISASDPDGNDIGFVATGLPPGLSIDSVSGLISGSLGYSLAASYNVTIQVIDNGTPPASSQVTFVWTIGEVNRPPVVAALSDRTDEQAVPVSITPSASDPDAGDTLSWSATGLPPGFAVDPASGVVLGAATSSGSFTVSVTATDDGSPALDDVETFSWTVTSPPGFPIIDEIVNHESLVGDAVSAAPTGSHPDGLNVIWSAEGLPEGLSIHPATGAISGAPTTAGSYSVTVALTDSRSQQVTATFEWLVVDPDLAPVATDDVVRVQIDRIGSGVAVDVIGNDIDPESAVLSLVSIGTPDVGTAEIVDGVVIFLPPSDWLGTVSFEYTVADASGNQATGTVTITVEESLSTLLAAAALQWDPATPSINLDDISLNAAAGTELVLGSVFQSLYTLRLPLALLSGAVFWSLLLGGILNLGFVLKGGLPRVVRRTSRNVAVVMVAHGGKLEALAEPGAGKPVWRFLATERGMEATGRRADGPGGEWAEVVTPDGHGWVPAINLTEEVDKAGFAEDPAPVNLIKDLVTRMRARHSITDLISEHGLAVAHHGPVHLHRPAELDGLMNDTTTRTWKGRNPAYPDFRGNFDLAVATSFLDAWDHPQRELIHDAPTVPSTVIPVEFTNLHAISVGADVHGTERLDQHAWLVLFTHEGGRARIIGLTKEG